MVVARRNKVFNPLRTYVGVLFAPFTRTLITEEKKLKRFSSLMTIKSKFDSITKLYKSVTSTLKFTFEYLIKKVRMQRFFGEQSF